MSIIEQHIEQIKSLCEAYNIKSLFAFGSVTTDSFKPVSDIDLIVEIDESDPLRYSNSYFKLKFSLEKVFKRKIDLLEHRAIRNPLLKKQIDDSKQLVFGR